MRSSDFSRAPARGRAEALLLVEHASRRALRGVSARARHDPRVLWRTPYRAAGRYGVLLGLADRAGLEAFAPADSAGGREGLPAGAVVRVHAAEESGYTNGDWRAEDATLAHIRRFTPVARERERGTTPPEVAAGGPGRAGAAVRGTIRSRTGTAARTSAARTSAARTPAEGGALFVGATHYRGPLALLLLARTWYPMIASMRSRPSYVWHTVYLGGPFVLGTIAFFETRDDLLVFARTPEHRHLMQWVVDGGRWARAGYIRLFVAETAGVPGSTGAAAEPGVPA